MEKDEKRSFGDIYGATNKVNNKIYVGQTVSSRWNESQVPIEERWKEEVGEAFRKASRGENLRNIERAIVKYGPENFELRELDRADTQQELDDKETYWINEYNTMDPEHGYNMKEGGLGGRLSEEAKEKLSDVISEKYQTDQEYREKQALERRERAEKNPEWVEKMTKINQERNLDPKWISKISEINQAYARKSSYQKNMSKSLSEKWEDPNYQESVSKGVSDKWQEEVYRERQFRSRKQGKREIKDREQFFKDIMDMNKKDLNEKYNMDGKCINRRIKEMLGHQGVNNFSQAKKYLENKNLDNVVKDVNERLANQPEKTGMRKDIANKEQFLHDIQTMKKLDVSEKYNLDGRTINRKINEMLGEHNVKNYTEAREYLRDKNLNDVVKEINERLSDQSEKYAGTSQITNKKDFLRDVQTMQKNEMTYKYQMDGKTLNTRISEFLGPKGPRNYSQLKDYMQDKSVDEVMKEIDEKQKVSQEKTRENINKEDKETPAKSSEKETPKESPQEEGEQVKHLQDEQEKELDHKEEGEKSNENLGDNESSAKEQLTQCGAEIPSKQENPSSHWTFTPDDLESDIEFWDPVAQANYNAEKEKWDKLCREDPAKAKEIRESIIKAQASTFTSNSIERNESLNPERGVQESPRDNVNENRIDNEFAGFDQELQSNQDSLNANKGGENPYDHEESNEFSSQNLDSKIQQEDAQQQENPTRSEGADGDLGMNAGKLRNPLEEKPPDKYMFSGYDEPTGNSGIDNSQENNNADNNKEGKDEFDGLDGEDKISEDKERIMSEKEGELSEDCKNYEEVEHYPERGSTHETHGY